MSAHQSLPRAQTLAELAPEWPNPLLAEIRKNNSGRRLVVLDDDPTGTQTVHDVPVLTHWDVATLAAELRNPGPCFFLLTNTRAFPLARAQAITREIGRNLRIASETSGIAYSVVSRSDSTLRGHYPGEVDALIETLPAPPDATLIAPFFHEGGRLTINDIHYVAEGDQLIPAADTPFAKDAAFGYRSSNLRNWVAEKGARSSGMDVFAIQLQTIRAGGPEGVLQELMALVDQAICIMNAASMRDMEVLARAVQMAEARGKRFVFRSAASFVQAALGMAVRAPLTAAEAGLSANGPALIIAGSHVPKTTAQLAALDALPNLARVEVDVNRLLDASTHEAEIARTLAATDAALASNRDTLVFTSRALQAGLGADDSLRIGAIVSEALVRVCAGLHSRPRYLVAKGGITSSDLATRALGMRRAMVLGQALPGVPLWRAGDESRWPGLAYVVFPGNVGGTDAILQLVQRWA